MDDVLSSRQVNKPNAYDSGNRTSQCSLFLMLLLNIVESNAHYQYNAKLTTINALDYFWKRDF